MFSVHGNAILHWNAHGRCNHYLRCLVRGVSQWLKRLPDNRMAWVQEPAIAGKHLYQYAFKKELLRVMQIFYSSDCWTCKLIAFQPKIKPILTKNLHVWLGSMVLCLNSLGHWNQRFERTLSWDKATWCNLSRNINSKPSDSFDSRSSHN